MVVLYRTISYLLPAGDDVPKKKPDPLIYRVAAERLGVAPGDCCVVEDSMIGLQAALGAGMRCIITYTPSTKSQVCSAIRSSVDVAAQCIAICIAV
jgi:beta-phosphoglucomutase-like phosphatase (HAD superfamily)